MELSWQGLKEYFTEFEMDLRRVRFWLLDLFVLTMPLVIYLGNTEYGYTKTIYTYVYISFLVIFWLVELLMKKKFEVVFSRLSVPVALLVISGSFSLFNAPSKGVVLQVLGLLIYFYLIYLLIINTVETDAEARYLLIALILSGLGATIYGALQYLGLVLGPRGFVPGPGSIISVVGNKNYLGGFISYLFIPTFSLVLLSKRAWLKLLTLASLGSFFFLLFPIGSDGAWLSLVSGIVVLLVGFLFYRPSLGLRDQKTWIVLIAFVLVLAYLFASAPGPLNSVLLYSATDEGGGAWGMFTPIVEPFYKRLIKQGGPRIEDWHIGLEMLKDHPIVGIGLGNYKIKFLEYRSKLLTSEAGESFEGYLTRGARAHNEYLQFVVEVGFLGLAALGFALVFTIWVIFQRIHNVKAPGRKFLGLALLGGLVGFFAHSTVSFPAHLPASSLAFVTFLGVINSKFFGRPPFTFKLSDWTRYLIVGLVTVSVITVSVFAYRDWRANILMGKGRTQMTYGNYRVAKEYLQDSKRLDFQPRQTYYYLGLVESQLGNQQKAVEYFEKSRGQFEPYNLFLRLGYLYLTQGRLEKAEQNLRKVLAMDAKREQRVKATHFLANLELERRNLGKATSLLQNALNMDPDYYQALILQGDIAASQRDEDKAKEKWQRALEVVDRRLREVNEKLSGEIPSQRYGELRSRRENLSEAKEKLTEKLKELY